MKEKNQTLKSPNFNAKAVLSKNAIVIAFVALFVAMAIARPGSFLRVDNILNIFRQTAVTGVLTLGMTFVLLTGGIDLSCGSIVALSGVVCAFFAAPGGPAMAKTGFTHGEGVSEFLTMQATLPLIVPILAALAVGATVGLVNGTFIARGGVPPFIVTMGMMTIVKGVALIVSDGGQLPYLTDEFKAIGKGDFFGVPYLAIIFIVLVLVVGFVLQRTCFGRHVYAIGGNEVSAHVSGINVKVTKTLVYVIAGMCSGIAGMLLASRTAVGSPQSGTGYEMDAIASCVIGGISLSGGVGSLFGSVMGVLFIAVMGNGMDMLGLNPYYQQIAKGVIIILAVLYDVNSRKSK